ncbi:hypothetical protein [Citricoccus sp.]|uniref:hypothetical protein n=1 Tax=Citricoccus sp. TaxID=1978372 RepID=UPI0028BF4921|nr:hypothetical protein [Citricoccus sp.]
MNINETAEVLARVQAYHQGFKVTDEKIIAWYELLEPYTLRDCIEAVKAYFRAPGDWIMPADIIERVKEYQQDRLGKFGDLRLSDADERSLLDRGPDWRHENRKLWALAANGHITPDDHTAYLVGRLTLDALSPKEISR